MGIVPAPKLQRLGRYEVIRHLATGGMAEIYLAHGVGEKVVVKVISPERAQDQKFIHMFLDEARVASTLHHPNIAQMLEVGRHGDTYFFAMEYIHGETARALLERAVSIETRIPLSVCLKIVASVAAGLHHAHERKGGTGTQLQIVHRDVTPSNIMLGFDGSVKLLDFGIAQAEGRAAETQSGTIKGKFAYMSPEQCRGKSVDRRTDVFALGIVMYELTTQRRAFRTDSDFDTMDRIVRGRLLRPTAIDAAYPRELEQILLRAMATEPAERFQTAADFGRAVEQYGERHGCMGTPDEVAACMHELFGTTDVEVRAVPEGTMSDVEMSISPGIAASVHESSMGTTLQDDDVADMASTQRRIRAPIAAALADAALEAAATGAFEPQMTGPMPVMSTARPTGPLDVAVPPAVTDTGPQPAVATASVNRPSQNRRPPSVSGPSPFAAPQPTPPSSMPQGSQPIAAHPGAPAKTILGAGIAARPSPSSTNPPPMQGPLDSGRRPPNVPVLPAVATPAPRDVTAPVSLAGESHLRVRQSRGLWLALVAIVLAAAAIAAVLMMA